MKEDDFTNADNEAKRGLEAEIDCIIEHFYSGTEKKFSAQVTAGLFSPKTGNRQAALEQLFEYIQNGKAEIVQKILNINPHIALVRWHAVNKENQIIKNKAGQLINVENTTGYQLL